MALTLPTFVLVLAPVASPPRFPVVVVVVPALALMLTRPSSPRVAPTAWVESRCWALPLVGTTEESACLTRVIDAGLVGMLPVSPRVLSTSTLRWRRAIVRARVRARLLPGQLPPALGTIWLVPAPVALLEHWKTSALPLAESSELEMAVRLAERLARSTEPLAFGLGLAVTSPVASLTPMWAASVATLTPRALTDCELSTVARAP